MKKSIIEMLNKIKYFISHPIVRYYIRHPLILFKNRVTVAQLWLKRIAKRDINFDDKIYSDTPIDVVIAAVDKDYDVLIYVIDSIRENVRHPIGDILIISPKSELIVNLCKMKKCVFVDENTVLPITKKNINYTVNGVNRSGWLFQQLLKWSGDKYVKNEHFLITDADTVFCRPQVFAHKDKVILSVNNQLCHIPYFDIYKKLLGIKIKPLINLTSHHLLYKKTILSELKRKIEEHCKVEWYKAVINSIDQFEEPSVSDYETYGQYFFSQYPDNCELEHWFNLSLSRKQINNLPDLVNKSGLNYKTISFHSYK